MRTPLWLGVARMCYGLTEMPGKGSNPVILQWAVDLRAPGYPDDDVAWCALFMNRVMAACQLPTSGAGYDLLRARTFEHWGVPLDFPALGAVLVFSRPEGAHVSLYVGERADAYRVLGGNTGNKVAEAWIAKDRLVAVRWPVGVPLPEGGPIMLTDNKPVSTNEA